MKVLLASTSLLAVPTFNALKRDGHEFLGLLTKQEEHSGRGLKLGENELIKELTLRGERIFRVSGHQELFQVLHEIQPDLVVTISFGLLVRKNSLAIPRHGWLNLHFSLLPKYRGAAPVQRAILAGETRTGVTVFKLDEGMDTGPIYTSKEIDIREKSTGTLLDELALIGAGEVLSAIDSIEQGKSPIEQKGVSSLAPKIESSETRLDFQESALNTSRRIRAFSPKPGAWCEYKGRRIKILEAEVSTSSGGVAGQISALAPLTISCGKGSLIVKTVQEAGKKAMSAGDWLRGSRVEVKESFE